MFAKRVLVVLAALALSLSASAVARAAGPPTADRGAPAQTSGRAVPSAPGRPARLPVPRGATQVGSLVGIVVCLLADLATRRRRWSIPILDLWRAAAAFSREAWRRMPVPLGLMVLGLAMSNAMPRPAGAKLIAFAVVTIASGAGLWASAGGSYRLALGPYGAEPPPRWGLKIGRVEMRLLGVLAWFGLLFVTTFMVLRVAGDMILGATGGFRLVDHRDVHYVLIGVSGAIVGAALTTVWPAAVINRGGTLRAAWTQSLGAWFPISIATILPNLTAYGVQRLSDWASAASHATPGWIGPSMRLFAAVAPSALAGFLLPFGIGVGAQLFVILANPSASADLASVFE
jgi:hypothetical protein